MNLRRRLPKFSVAVASLLLVAPIALPEVASAGVDQAQAEVDRTVDMLDNLHQQADILAEDYNEALDRKAELDQEVAEAEAKVAAKEAELSKLRGDLGEVAVRAFTGSGTDVLGPLFSSPNQYGDGLQREQYSRVALSIGTTTTDDLDELIASLDADRKDLEAKREQVTQLTKTIEQKQAQTADLLQQYTQAKADAEARLGAAIQAEEQRRAAEAWAKMQAEAAAQIAASQSNSGSSSNAGSGGGGGGGGNATSNDGSNNANAGGGGDSGGSTATVAPPPPPVNIPSVSGLAGVAVQAALSQQGVPYRYATSIPGVNFDCSGLTHYAWSQAGVYLPRNSRAQAAAVPHVPAGSAQPGDLIFYYSPISHVGIYVGGGQYVHAPATGDVVKVSSVSWNKVTAVGRPG